MGWGGYLPRREKSNFLSSFLNGPNEGAGSDANRGTLAERLFEATLGSHYINLAAYRLLTPDRRIGLLKDVLALCREKGVTGYQAGAFVIGSLVEPGAEAAFWTAFEPREIAGLLSEWLVHQKYLNVLDAVGERRVNRARSVILAQGLAAVQIHRGWAVEFEGLRSSGVDFDEVRRHVGEGYDPQTAELLDALKRLL